MATCGSTCTRPSIATADTIDFLLRAHRDYAAARRFLERAIELHGVPEKITIDKCGANTAVIESLRADSGADIELRQVKVPQQHRGAGPQGGERVVRPTMGFKSFHCARAILAGVEMMHMLKKGQLDCPKAQALSAASQFYTLAY